MPDPEIRFDHTYLLAIYVMAGALVLTTIVAAVAISRMHAASMGADSAEKTKVAGEFYEGSGLKIATVMIVVAALVALAVLRLVRGSEVVGAISAIGG